MSPKTHIISSNQDWCRACNDPHVQNSCPIFQHQTKLVENNRVNTNYYVDEGASKVNFMILSEPINQTIETRL